MTDVKSLLVLWKNSATSLYYHVGTLYFDGKEYTFQYTCNQPGHRKVNEAKLNGYRLHPAFPMLEATYSSTNLFSAFDRRIPSSDREDFAEVLLSLGLDKNSDRMDILGETRGMLAGDSYSFEQPIRLSENRHLSTSFYINGMRHRDLPANWILALQKDKTVKFVIDEYNLNDPYAVKIKTLNGMHLGFVPAVYAEAIKSLLQRNIKFNISITDIRPKAEPQWWVSLAIEADLKENQFQYVNKTQLNGLVQKSA